ncbi:MAG: hypothetical protein GF416_05330 [Candidatus Altiarchaeales archaeon]|nr:hypothetical protein [Candidatus Altiarchaeales archaeon]MBD3416539.1 hypothetical protein [Candidatus Altiarchaeales archaeon]
MDPGSGVYAYLLNKVTGYFSEVNGSLAEKALQDSRGILDEAKVKYTIDKGLITITESEEKHINALYDFTLSVAEVFESKYGVNEVWGKLKKVMVSVLVDNKTEVKEYSVELPIAKYRIRYMRQDNVVGFSTAKIMDKDRWLDGQVLVTNHRMVFQETKTDYEVPLSAIATIGREIYLKGVSSRELGGVIRMIDFRMKPELLSCALFLAEKEFMREFMRVVSIARGEYARLNDVETRVLLALYREVPAKELPMICNIGEWEAKKSFERILDLGFVDKGGHLTSYGINTAEGYLKQNR